MWRPERWIGLDVRSGTGEAIGRVVGILRDGSDRAVALQVAEDGPYGLVFRTVEFQHMAAVGDDGIRLKGPRQGYHIARLWRPPPAPGTEPTVAAHGEVVDASGGSGHVPTR